MARAWHISLPGCSGQVKLPAIWANFLINSIWYVLSQAGKIFWIFWEENVFDFEVIREPADGLDPLNVRTICRSSDNRARLKCCPLVKSNMIWPSDNQHTPGGRINIKMSSYQHRKSHYGDKTILRPSYLHNGISYTGKMSSLYWIRAQQVVHFQISICKPTDTWIRKIGIQTTFLKS